MGAMAEGADRGTRGRHRRRVARRHRASGQRAARLRSV